MRGYLGCAILLVSCFSWATEPPITNFHQVSGEFYRGARPEKIGVEYLAARSFKTIINIDDDEYAIEEEQKIAEKLGINMVSIPLSGFFSPSSSNVDQILEWVSDTKQYPLFLHCKHGQDRTGMIVGLYRVEYENRAPTQAYQEMLDLGFHTILWGLNHYFKERTGLDDLNEKPWLSLNQGML
jgi:protein tyrosine/serine phosphatase